jgi:selenocysteine lyase/cysteine desulfurase
MNINQLRADTPGCATKVHFNNAGASLMPRPVIEAQKKYLDLESVTGGYETSDALHAEISGFYSSMGKLLNTSSENIAFTSSATNSFARALSSIPFEKGDIVLLANEDYISNQLAFLSLQKRLGIRLVRAESLPEGGVDVDSMRRLMDQHKPRLVTLTHVPTNSGLVQPVEEVGKLCKERNLLYLVDGCQSVGQMPVDMKTMHCDFFTGTFRKFLRGPRGTGFLFVSDNVLQQNLWPLFVDMRGADWITADTFKIRKDARRFEDWEFPYALLVGCPAAVDYALEIGLDEIQERNSLLCSIVRTELAKLNLKVLDRGNKLSSIITVEIPIHEPVSLLQSLRKRNINTSISSRSSAVIDYDAKGVSWALRISPHYYNTEEEIALLLHALQEIG